MSRNLTLTRDDAENLVDLLENCDPKKEGYWRHILAADIREMFGMISLEDEKSLKGNKNAGSDLLHVEISSE